MKTIINIILGIGAILILNDNADAVYLNMIGLACVAGLIAINKQRKDSAKFRENSVRQ